METTEIKKGTKMLNRRQFFKRAGGFAAMCAGVSIIPDKTDMPVFRPNPVQQTWMQTYGPYSGKVFIKEERRISEACGLSTGDTINGLKASAQSLGTRLILPDGRRYMCVKWCSPCKKGQAVVWNLKHLYEVESI